MKVAKVQVTRTVAQNNHQHGFLQISHMPCHSLPQNLHLLSPITPAQIQVCFKLKEREIILLFLFYFVIFNYICNITLIKNVEWCDNIFSV